MVPAVRNAADKLGYDNPSLLLRRTAWMSATFALATVAGKFFVSDLNIKSHLTFGQVLSLSFNLIYYNKYSGKAIDKCPNPLKKDVFHVINFLALLIIPTTIGKLFASKCWGNISWIQAGKRTVYFGGFGIVTLCMSELYKREQKRQGL
ncbi:MAG: hypothetical protein KFB93_04920 [Simkaniaceae bacterium]|nr:MAG: hypothetical protein KFB93_04920 [Simkaniaceae bacterium]